MSRDEFCFQFPDDIDQLNQASHAVWRVSLGIGASWAQRCSSWRNSAEGPIIDLCNYRLSPLLIKPILCYD